MLRFLAACVAISSVASLFSVEGTLGRQTVKTEHGSMYDCVDIYKQPALDHPRLKDHKIQMRPSFDVQKTTSLEGATKFGLKNECPTGTVPILRMTKEERLRAKASFTDEFQKSASGFEFAGISTVLESNKKYHGAGGYVSTYNPFADHGQFSASIISIEDGPPEHFSNIRVGWMVNPNLFGDNLTRLYTVWGQGVDGTMHGCYDTRCPGFVLVSTKVTLNLAFTNISVPGGTQFYINLVVSQDKPTGNWWLLYSENDGAPEEVGYWPSNLFTNLKDGAQVIRWGGMVYSDKPKSPPMGSGGRDCHFRRLSVTGLGSNSSSVAMEPLESRCYKVGDNSYKDEFWGYSFWFGGPGGDTKDC